MSQINVDSIANKNEDGPVYFPYGMRGDATNLIYEPKVLYFDPVPLSTGISTNTNITITFDQQIQFSGVGTIYIREGSPTGSITTSFTCGVSVGATIAGETLVIDPTEPLGINTTNYVVLPPVGIANTFGAMYKGTSAYFFQTLKPSDLFSASGGNSEFTIASPTSPTGYYKYHVFTTTGILTTSASSFDADSLSALAVAGGGGGGGTWAQPSSNSRYTGGGGGAGGRIYAPGPAFSLEAGTYTITIGAGGIGTDGNNTTISTPTTTIITAYGGGMGADGAISGGQQFGSPGGSGGGGAGNSTPSNPGSVFYGNGTPSQGNNGGGFGPYNQATNPTNVSRVWFGGGGGGANGTGGNATATFSPPAPGTSSNYRGPGTGGPGGAGAPSPEFSSPLIAPYVPTIPPGSWSAIGPTGLYAGGGGGGGVSGPSLGLVSPNPAYPTGPFTRGAAGPGGGGAGVLFFAIDAEDGYANTGGGGGGGGEKNATLSPNPSPTSYLGPRTNGGSGVFMIRYAVPAP